MPSGISVLSTHKLFSQFHGPFIYNDATPPAPAPATPPEPPKGGEGGDPAPRKGKDDDTEGRISELSSTIKELKKQIKDREDSDKKAEEEKLAKKGEHEKLAQQYAAERDAEKQRAADLEGKVKAYEEYAQGQIKQGLEAITDAEKRKSAEAMLEGLSTEEQMKRLPNILKLVGTGTQTFGSGTPPTKIDGASLDQKKARYQELLKKPNITPQEKNERHTLMTELTKVWNDEQAAKKAI